MANYNTYTPLGIDAKIKFIQDALHGHLGFSNVDFYGRVQKSLNKDSKTYIPEVHVSKTERKEVYYDDAIAPGGNVFFVEEDDKHTTKDGVVFVAKVKIVFMLNLDKVYPNANNRADTEVQDHCLKLVRRLKILDITAVEKGVSNVLKGFNIENVKLNDMQPYHIFSINGELKYMFNCKTESGITNNNGVAGNSFVCANGNKYIQIQHTFNNPFTPSLQTKFKDLTSLEITEMWLNNNDYNCGIGGLSIFICTDRFEIGSTIRFSNNSEIMPNNSIWNGYYIANQSGYSGNGSINGVDIEYRFNPNRSCPYGATNPITNPPLPLTFWADTVEPVIIKIEGGVVTEIISLPMTGFAYEG